MWTLTHTATGLQFAYGLVLIPMIAGLYRGRACILRYIKAPWPALVITVICVLVLWFVSQYLYLHHVKDSALDYLFALVVFAGLGYTHGLGTAIGDEESESGHQ